MDNVSFDVHSGEVFGLLGPNGAGKTTCLRMLVTLLRPDSGTASIAGFDTQEAAEEVKRRIGFQTGDTRLYERLTPVEFLRYFGTLHGMDRSRLEQRIPELVEALDITSYKKRHCGTLSTGQQQRVSIARALLHDPDVLILDEPTSGLDIVSAQYIVSLLKAEAARGKAVIFSTHIMAEAELICDRIGVMAHGKIVATGSVDDLKAATDEGTMIRAFLHLVGSDPEVSP